MGMIIFMVISCFVIILTILVMGYIAKVILWTLLLAVHVALVAGIFYCYLKYTELRSDKNTAADPNNYNLEANMDYYTSLYKTWFYMGIGLAVLLGVILL